MFPPMSFCVILISTKHGGGMGPQKKPLQFGLNSNRGAAQLIKTLQHRLLCLF